MAIQDRHWYIEELKKRDRHKRGGRHGAASLKALTVILSSFGLGFLSALLLRIAFSKRAEHQKYPENISF